jgi:hypothetical protein
VTSDGTFAKVAADRCGDVIALVESRGGRPAYDATVQVYDGRTSERLASFEGPKLSHLRLAVRGDRIVVGDYTSGMIVGFDLAGAAAWAPITVHPETLDSLTPSPDGERILAWVTEAGRVRRVLASTRVQDSSPKSRPQRFRASRSTSARWSCPRA